MNAELDREEFRALRATIRERGSLRLLVAGLTFVAWATSAAVFESYGSRPLSALASLIVLAAGFEVVFAAHVSVERIGRYLQVRYETGPAGSGWETTAMKLGLDPGSRLPIDPLFSLLFLGAATVNLLLFTPIAAILLGSPISGAFSIESIVGAVVHVIFAARLVQARRISRAQRTRDLALMARALGL